MGPRKRIFYLRQANSAADVCYAKAEAFLNKSNIILHTTLLSGAGRVEILCLVGVLCWADTGKMFFDDVIIIYLRHRILISRTMILNWSFRFILFFLVDWS